MLPQDPVMLASYINLKLRDCYRDLDELCDDLDENKSELLEKLKSAGFRYDEATKQVK